MMMKPYWSKSWKAEKVLQNVVVNVEDKHDYNEVVTHTLFKNQKPGQYLILVSNTEDFDEAFSVTPLTVTNLAYVNPNGNKSDCIVMVNRTTGKPIKELMYSFIHWNIYPIKAVSERR